MDVSHVQVIITGTMPLLMHADNIDWADEMEAWKNKTENKSKSKAGDDRTPPWRWIGNLNFDDPNTGVVTIPSEYIMAAIREGATQILTGKGKATFKAKSQSGLICADFHWPLLASGKAVPMSDIQTCRSLKTFSEQKQVAERLGFSLFVKRARIGQSKHVRVRPRFDKWSTSGEIVIVDDDITKETLQEILNISGRYKGLGDWRPSSKTPGPFGTFTAEVV